MSFLCGTGISNFLLMYLQSVRRGVTEQMLYSRLKINVYLSFMQLSDT